MLGIGVLASGRAAYYLDSVAAGREEYYLGAGEAPGRWLGTHAATFGLDGEVDAAALSAVLDGANPSTGDRLAPPRKNRTPGFDLTFSAPKSVSILFALGDDKLAVEAREAHDAAVRAALGWLERNACRVRRGAAGVVELAGDGFVAAAFRHRTSRAGDPQLHTHVVVANLTRGPDGIWSTLDGRHLFAHGKTAGHLYQAHLRHELTRRLGLAWEPVQNGVADLRSIPRELIEGLSTRRHQIEQRLDELGLTSARAAQIAALDTRTAKDLDVDIDALRNDWHALAADHGIDARRLRALVGREFASEPDRAAVTDALVSPTGLTAHRSTFDRRDLLRAWCNQLPHGAPIPAIEALADQTLHHPQITPLARATNEQMRRKDGRRMSAPNLGHRYTTHELLALELRLLHDAELRTRDRVGVVDPWFVAEALRRRPTLDEDQRHLVIALTTGGGGVEVVTAPAGSGKTYALAAAHDAWKASGHNVVGCAVAARAARQLEHATGIPSTTIAAIRRELAVSGQPFPPNTVLVVDEAAMAGTRTLAPLLDAAKGSQTKVVLVGDHRQLPEIDAGGLVRALERNLGAIRLYGNRRQEHVWEQRALAWLRDGRTDTALDTYMKHARVAIDDTAAARQARMASDYVAARLRGENVLMLASRWRDVHDLNRQARRLLDMGGYLNGPTLTVADHEYKVGDRVMTLRNRKRLGVTNGTTGTVALIDVDRRSMTIDTDDHLQVVLPADYLDGRGIVHAYATTIHKAQGATVDRALILASDELTRERAYTALSRGRLENRLYLVAHDVEFDHSHLAQREPSQDLRSWVRRSEAQHLAADQGMEVDIA